MSRTEPMTPLNPSGAPFHRAKFGEIEICTVFEGSAARPISPDFFRNVALGEVQDALKAGGFARDAIPNSYTVTIARIGGRLVMFDTGFGEHAGPQGGWLRRNMQAAGIAPADLSAIVITHYHPDHIHGLMTKSLEQVYPDLPIHVPAAEHDFWSDPANETRMPPSRLALARRVRATMAGWPNLVPYADGDEVLPGIRAVASPGHSAGHSSLLLGSGNHQVMVLGDVTNIPSFNMRHPGWHLAADDDPQLAEATRRSMLARLAAERIPCTGYHWGMPGIGHVSACGDGGYQLEVGAMD
ncbi:MBL fold metallo-hydrolase [Paracoccus sp. CPCC 101403]|uniref:MBL fold metallo-hydrolase n=1 Tax=Paracoccus broussonetiae TaxID=3075834 RepID=A0ABU3EJE2_9RHOB|nr:MBL fold metallo-hydrolase [Paracoccus sp. CPCC 101403]MDT1064240.1 MBL fold metallo-hydrolase [Paracoccus sp. CPCC 101403]